MCVCLDATARPWFMPRPGLASHHRVFITIVLLSRVLQGACWASAASGLLELNLVLGEEDGWRKEGGMKGRNALSFVELFLIPQVGSMASSRPLLSNLAVKCTADEAVRKRREETFCTGSQPGALISDWESGRRWRSSRSSEQDAWSSRHLVRIINSDSVSGPHWINNDRLMASRVLTLLSLSPSLRFSISSSHTCSVLALSLLALFFHLSLHSLQVWNWTESLFFFFLFLSYRSVICFLSSFAFICQRLWFVVKQCSFVPAP